MSELSAIKHKIELLKKQRADLVAKFKVQDAAISKKIKRSEADYSAVLVAAVASKGIDLESLLKSKSPTAGVTDKGVENE